MSVWLCRYIASFDYVTDCGKLHVQNGELSTRKTTYGSDVMLECRPGYGLTSPSSSTCQQDGTWSVVLTDCVKKGKFNRILQLA